MNLDAFMTGIVRVSCDVDVLHRTKSRNAKRPDGFHVKVPSTTLGSPCSFHNVNRVTKKNMKLLIHIVFIHYAIIQGLELVKFICISYRYGYVYCKL